MDRNKVQEFIELDAKVRDIRIALADINYLKINTAEQCDIRIATKTGAVKVSNVIVIDEIKALVDSLKEKLNAEYAELNAKIESI